MSEAQADLRAHDLTTLDSVLEENFSFMVTPEFGPNFEVRQMLGWCADEFGEDAISGFNSETGEYSVDMSKNWTVFAGTFCFRDLTAAVHFKLRWC